MGFECFCREISEYSDCRRDLDVEAYVEHEESKIELEDMVAGAVVMSNGDATLEPRAPSTPVCAHNSRWQHSRAPSTHTLSSEPHYKS